MRLESRRAPGSALSMICSLAALAVLWGPAAGQPLEGTKPLTTRGDIAAQMVTGIDRYLAGLTADSVAGRAARWRRDYSSWPAYARSIEPNRVRFRQILGLVDARVPAHMEVVGRVPGAKAADAAIARARGYRIYAVRWSVMKGVDAEGLLMQPDRAPVANVIAAPDCDWTPEQIAGLETGVPAASQYARRLAEAGCRVLVPALIDRRDTHSGIPGVRMTNQPHREFLQRAAYEMGRTMPGIEVQKLLAAVDALESQASGAESLRLTTGVIGYGEGGLLAFYAAACDPRIDACCVSGYFGPREGLVDEPIYRNLFGLFREFGDAEIASLIAPRALIVEACRHPEIAGPPKPSQGRSGAAPGAIRTPSAGAVAAEYERAQEMILLLAPLASRTLIVTENGLGDPCREPVVNALLRNLGVIPKPARTKAALRLLDNLPDSEARLKRQFDQILEYTQRLMRESPNRRAEFWAKADASSPEKWAESTRAYREFFRKNVIGDLPEPTVPPNPRTRLIYDTPKVRGYEVILDLYEPGVFAYGILLLPKDLKPGEKRPVVVCQHGLEGRPQDVADPDHDNPAYHRFAYRLAEEGFITYAPQNPYIGETRFRQVLRRAQPLGLTLFAFIARQHERTLDWLAGLPFVDSGRMAFYGLSYGGKTAMRIPALLERYCLSICSADYNEWIWKNSSAQSPYSYLVTNEYDMPEWNLANTFNYAEMSWLICPRPFMVERGHHDGVAPDEWVAYEYARTRRRYDLLGLGERTELEVFNGPHTINGQGTFAFLRKHLRWPGR